MKKNLLAILLAVIMVAAVIFIAAPATKAETIEADYTAVEKVIGENTVVQVVDAHGDKITEITDNNKVLNLNGLDATISIKKGVTLTIVDTKFMEGDWDLTGNSAGTLTLDEGSGGTINAWAQFNDYKYLAVKSENGTYSAHPFNIMVSSKGVNTHSAKIIVGITVIADNVVADLIDKGEFGLHNTTLDNQPNHEEYDNRYAKHWAKFDGKNGLRVYFDLNNSLSKDVLTEDRSNEYGAYIKVNAGYDKEVIVDSKTTTTVTPTDILTDLNEKAGRFSLAQKLKMQAMINRTVDGDEVAYLESYCENFIPQNYTLSFENTDNRTEFSSEKQVWEQNGIIFTNEKAASTTNIADYSNPVRLYKSSSVTIAASGITQIVIVSDDEKEDYKTALETSLTEAGHTWVNSDSTYTITFTEAVDSITFSLAGQARFNSITVTAYPPCEHKYEITSETQATCTEDGLKVETCSKCEGIKETVIKATGEHTYQNGECTGCGIEEGNTEAQEQWTLADLADIKSTDIVVIVWIKGDTLYALSSANGASSAPTAEIVKVDGDKLTDNIADDIKWNITNNSGNLTIYPNGTTATWLYCTATNNGVRVGTNTNNVFTIDATSGYLKNTATNRYLGVYTTNPDVRCYTSTTTNIADQTLAFYVCNTGTSGGETPENPETPACQHTNTTETVTATCTAAGSKTVTCNDCGEVVSTEEIAALGHTTDNGTCGNCGLTIGGNTEPTVVLAITKDDFNTTSYAANNNTKTEGDYSYTSYQVMNQSSTMQWQSKKGYITLSSNPFVKLEIKVTAGSYTVTVGGTTVTGTTSNGVTTYDLSNLTGEVKIAVGNSTGKVEYIKFYK